MATYIQMGSTISTGTVYPKKYAHGFCFAVLCCGYTFTDFPISIRLTSLALWQSDNCPSASKAPLMNMDKYFMWIHYERLHNHNKAKHNKTVCIFLGIYCSAKRVDKQNIIILNMHNSMKWREVIGTPTVNLALRKKHISTWLQIVSHPRGSFRGLTTTLNCLTGVNIRWFNCSRWHHFTFSTVVTRLD